MRPTLIPQPLRHRDHLVPGGRRLGHQVLAVPQQLDVRVLRRGVELVLVPGGLQRPFEGAFLHLGAVLPGPFPDPVGAGELLGPGHVEAEHVHAVVLGREPAHHLHPLLVGLPRQNPVDDAVPPTRLGVAPVDHLLEVLLRRVVQVDRGHPAVTAGGTRRHRCHKRQCRGRRRHPHAGPRRTPTGSLRSLMTLPSISANSRGGLRAPAHGETARACDLRIRTPAFRGWNTARPVEPRNLPEPRRAKHRSVWPTSCFRTALPSAATTCRFAAGTAAFRRRMSVPAGMIGG